MKSQLVLSSILLLALSFTAAAQPATITVTPVEYGSAAEQLAAARQLQSEIALAKDLDERSRAVALAAATAEVVARKWPTDGDAVLAAALLQADAMLEGAWAKSARSVLLKALPVAEQRKDEALVLIRLAKVAARLGDLRAAARYAEDATRPARTARMAGRTKADTLRNAALILTDADESKKAAVCWRQAASSDVSPFERANYAVAAAKANSRAGDRAAARSDAAVARRWLLEARAKPPAGPGAFEALSVLEKELDTVE